VWRNESGNPEETAWRGKFRPRTVRRNAGHCSCVRVAEVRKSR
jgi:hypothetical protein